MSCQTATRCVIRSSDACLSTSQSSVLSRHLATSVSTGRPTTSCRKCSMQTPAEVLMSKIVALQFCSFIGVLQLWRCVMGRVPVVWHREMWLWRCVMGRVPVVWHCEMWLWSSDCLCQRGCDFTCVCLTESLSVC